MPIVVQHQPGAAFFGEAGQASGLADYLKWAAEMQARQQAQAMQYQQHMAALAQQQDNQAAQRQLQYLGLQDRAQTGQEQLALRQAAIDAANQRTSDTLDVRQQLAEERNQNRLDVAQGRWDTMGNQALMNVDANFTKQSQKLDWGSKDFDSDPIEGASLRQERATITNRRREIMESQDYSPVEKVSRLSNLQAQERDLFDRVPNKKPEHGENYHPDETGKSGVFFDPNDPENPLNGQRWEVEIRNGAMKRTWPGLKLKQQEMADQTKKDIAADTNQAKAAGSQGKNDSAQQQRDQQLRITAIKNLRTLYAKEQAAAEAAAIRQNKPKPEPKKITEEAIREEMDLLRGHAPETGGDQQSESPPDLQSGTIYQAPDGTWRRRQ